MQLIAFLRRGEYVIEIRQTYGPETHDAAGGALKVITEQLLTP